LNPSAGSNGRWIKIFEAGAEYVFAQPYNHVINLPDGTTFTVQVDTSDFNDYKSVDVTEFDDITNISIATLAVPQSKTSTWTSTPVYSSKIPNNIIVGEATAGKKVTDVSFDGHSNVNTLILGSATTALSGARFQSSYFNIFTQTIPSGSTITSSDFKFLLQVILVGTINYSKIMNLQEAIIQGSLSNTHITACDLITSSRNILGSNLTRISASYLYSRVEYSDIMNFSNCYLGKKSTASIFQFTDLYTVDGEDFETSTHIYSASYAKTVMGTTGASHVLYIDNNGTVQTDLTTN
jgi:hypothetical protein